jgi:lysophospholipase
MRNIASCCLACVSDEMGSYDPTLAAFTPMKYLGTMNESICVTNYDQTGLVIGASGDWNTYYNTSVEAPFRCSRKP